MLPGVTHVTEMCHLENQHAAETTFLRQVSPSILMPGCRGSFCTMDPFVPSSLSISAQPHPEKIVDRQCRRDQLSMVLMFRMTETLACLDEVSWQSHVRQKCAPFKAAYALQARRQPTQQPNHWYRRTQNKENEQAGRCAARTWDTRRACLCLCLRLHARA